MKVSIKLALAVPVVCRNSSTCNRDRNLDFVALMCSQFHAGCMPTHVSPRFNHTISTISPLLLSTRSSG
ncbi:hypothetical protein VNO77_22404 [Canavalia gladiata]|uniref:Uncharacterized protein n=1 Tax=Canavalia gladiata TaxID=3824 RepID=A0AAN9L3X7_CANGL